MAMQRNYFTVLFFLKKSKLLKNGEAPICMRITVNGVLKSKNGIPKKNVPSGKTG